MGGGNFVGKGKVCCKIFEVEKLVYLSYEQAYVLHFKMRKSKHIGS